MPKLQKKPRKIYDFIPCENILPTYDFTHNIGLIDRLFINKLEEKCQYIKYLYNAKNKDWEATLTCLLAHTFGLKNNSVAFENIFTLINYKIIRKIARNKNDLEALLLGITHNLTLSENIYDTYSKNIYEKYQFLKLKYSLSDLLIPIKYSHSRPHSFPSLRLSQLAHLLSHYQNLFSFVIGCKNINQFFCILDEIQASAYWDNHFVFGKQINNSTKKKLSKSQKELIIINAFLPIKFAYALSIGKSIIEEIISILNELPAENNSIITNFMKLGIKFYSAYESQAFLNLHKNKCMKHACANCEIGYYIYKT